MDDIYGNYDDKVLFEGVPTRSHIGRAFQRVAYHPELTESADKVREILSVDTVEWCAVRGAALFLCTNRAPCLHEQSDASDMADARVLDQILVYGEFKEHEMRLLLTQCLEGGKPHCVRTLLSHLERVVGREHLHTQVRTYFVRFLRNKKVAVVFDEYGFGDVLMSRDGLLAGCFAASPSMSEQLHSRRNTNPPVDMNACLLEYVLSRFRHTETPIPQQYMQECMDFLMRASAANTNSYNFL